jgi:low affinity Fe/Cu permease
VAEQKRSQRSNTQVEHVSAFDRFCDWVSEAMGRPLNIIFWAVFVVAWTLVFALGGPRLASGSWLPAWFTSQGYNFPLNLVTTVAELFIGFLVATAANRAQNALTLLLFQIKTLLDAVKKEDDEVLRTGKSLAQLVVENNELTKKVNEQTAQSIETHQHVLAICRKLGVTSDEFGAAGAEETPPT